MFETLCIKYAHTIINEMDNLKQRYCSQIQGALTKSSEPSEKPMPVEEAKEEEKAALANPSDSKLE